VNSLYYHWYAKRCSQTVRFLAYVLQAPWPYEAIRKLFTIAQPHQPLRDLIHEVFKEAMYYSSIAGVVTPSCTSDTTSSEYAATRAKELAKSHSTTASVQFDKLQEHTNSSYLILLNAQAIDQLSFITNSSGFNTVRDVMPATKHVTAINDLIYYIGSSDSAQQQTSAARVMHVNDVVMVATPSKQSINLKFLSMKETFMRQRVVNGKSTLVFQLLNYTLKSSSAPLYGGTSVSTEACMQIHIQGYKDTTNNMYYHLKPQKSKLTFAMSKHSSTQDKLEFLFDRVEIVARDGDHIVYLVPSANGYARLAAAINSESNTVQSGIMYGHLQFGDSQYQFQEPFAWDSTDSSTDRQANDQSSYEYKFTAIANSI
jgi:hypothetical protein